MTTPADPHFRPTNVQDDENNSTTIVRDFAYTTSKLFKKIGVIATPSESAASHTTNTVPTGTKTTPEDSNKLLYTTFYDAAWTLSGHEPRTNLPIPNPALLQMFEDKIPSTLKRRSSDMSGNSQYSQYSTYFGGDPGTMSGVQRRSQRPLLYLPPVESGMEFDFGISVGTVDPPLSPLSRHEKNDEDMGIRSSRPRTESADSNMYSRYSTS
jgi:hypothetical protein